MKRTQQPTPNIQSVGSESKDCGEELAAVRALKYLESEAALGRREGFERFLAAVPHREVPETDTIPE